MLFELKNVYFKYEREWILENISFNINRQEIITIVGPNGGGKTTLIKLLLGLLKPTKGKIHFKQQPLCKIKKNDFNIGYVPQLSSDSSLNKKVLFSVYDILNIHYYKNKKLKKQNIDKILKNLKIENLKNKIFSTLSGGQQQRVLIARALLNEPEVLILDEPSTGIDSNSEFMLYNFLKELKEQKNTTIILVTHDLDIVPSISDRVACLNKQIYVHNKVEDFLFCPVFEDTFDNGLELLVHGKNIPHRLLNKKK